MDIAGRNILVLGGSGLVGLSVCRALIKHQPARLVVASHHKTKSYSTVRQLKAEYQGISTLILPAWGDVFLRAEWQQEQEITREEILADSNKRRQLLFDILNPLDEEIINSSLLTHIIKGKTAI